MAGSLTIADVARCMEIAEVKCVSFVETGTCRGDTALEMQSANAFPGGIYTVEASPELYAANQNRLRDCEDVRLYFGRSETMLEQMLAHAPEPRLVFLDAHQTQMDPRAAKGPLPLLSELQALREAGGRNVVIVDDCRLLGKDEYDRETDGASWAEATIKSMEKAVGVPLAFWLDSDRAVFVT